MSVKRQWTIILSAATVLLVAAMLGTVMVAHHQATKQWCDASAVQQLPADVVATVNAAQQVYRVPEVMGEDIATRQNNRYVKTVAFRSFEPDYCGYIGNINGRPTDYGQDHQTPAWAFNQLADDKVIVLKDGVPFDNKNQDICIGNTPPEARLTNGHIEMILWCDRTYPSETWMQEVPDLTP